MKTLFTAIVIASLPAAAQAQSRTNVSSRLPPYTAQYTQTNLSAFITAATNRVSTLRNLDFTVVITNIAETNVVINPWILKNGLGTVSIFDASGLIMAQRPEPPLLPQRVLRNPNTQTPSQPPTLAGIDAQTPHERVLKPGETYTLDYKLGDYMHATPPGKYRAREGFIPSNEVEITIE